MSRPTATSDPLQSPPRLNPFTFPSDTDFRFVLLILITVGASIFIYSRLYVRSFSTAELARLSAVGETQLQETLARCRAEYEASRPADPLADREAYFAAEAAFIQCQDVIFAEEIWWILSGIILVFFIATVIYILLPLWKIKRNNLSPLSKDDAPDVVEYLQQLCKELGVSKPPEFVWNPLDPVCSGLAFGRTGRYYIGLSGGLITQFYTDRPIFRAVVSHELAHLLNRDIDKTYFTVAIWWAFIISAILPWGIVLFGLPLTNLLQISLIWRLLALGILVYLTRNAVLRVREIYADIRASTFDGTLSGLDQTLAALPQLKVSWWRHMFKLHPNPVIRRQCLQDTRPLFQLSLWDILATGIASSIVLPGVLDLLNVLNLRLWSNFIAGLVFGSLIVAIVGTGIWRATFAAALGNQMPQYPSRQGLVLGFGILLGFSLTLSGLDGTDGRLPETFGDQVLFFSFQGLWSVLMLISLMLFVHWMAFSAKNWLPLMLASTSPRLIYVVGLGITSLMLAIWFGILFLGRDFGATFLSVLSGFEGVVGLVLVGVTAGGLSLQSPILFVMLICFWAFPLAPHLWRLRSGSSTTTIPTWAYLDDHQREPTALLEPVGPEIKTVLKPALIGGVVFCILWLLLRMVVSEMFQETDQFKIGLFFTGIFLAATIQAAISGFVAKGVNQSASLYGLLAAFVAGIVISTGLYGINISRGGTVSLDLFWFNLSQVINAGTLMALPTTFIVTRLSRWLRTSIG